MSKWYKLRKLCILCICFLLAFPICVFADIDSEQYITAEEEEQYRTDTEIEEAYAARSLYVRELMMKDLHRLREEYTNTLPDSSLRSQIVNYALSWVGVTPYVWAGRSLESGTDCSGFIYLIFQQFGYQLSPASDLYQDYIGYHVNYEDLLPGDIIVYGNGGHVGIYAGDDLVIHCSSPEAGTVVYNMWYRTPTAYVRVLD